jgi:hypothetical protein
MMTKEMISLPRENIYSIFSEAYKTIANSIEDFFGPEETTDKELLKEYYAFKELIINSIDDIHKQILLKNIEYNEAKKIKKEEENKQQEEDEEEKKKGFWD